MIGSDMNTNNYFSLFSVIMVVVVFATGQDSCAQSIGHEYYVSKNAPQNYDDVQDTVRANKDKIESSVVFGIKVVGGDTIVIRDGDSNKIVRLYGVDAPDEGQVGNKSSENQLRILAVETNDPIVINIIGNSSDRFGRPHVIAYKKGVCLNSEQVWLGEAMVDPNTCKEPECADWREKQESAKKSRVGIWSLPGDVETPWDYRAKHSRSFSKKDSGVIEGVFYAVKGGSVVATIPEFPSEKFYLYPRPVVMVNRGGPQINIINKNENTITNKIGN